MLKLSLQLLFCVCLALRVVALVQPLRRAWRGSPAPLATGHALARAFQQELRRRGHRPEHPLTQPD